ncbi:MAG: hypothetical protein JJT87_12700 [Halomonas sp.]|uniref:hypothetical protein n=1 Tax=unclassified Halomonas TaxID=2609666 RepID=UPI00099083CA|nr:MULTISPECIES: hypothetical protein [unclassified Halomonas]AQU84955.1 hypothetical protein B2G49_21620 [Halomonas sp. 'Soap Lake \
MKTIPLGMSCLLLLVGCQTIPDRLPQAEPAPAASCYFPVNSVATPQSSSGGHSQAQTQKALDQSVAVLEEWGFELVSTDTSLGLVSASRQRDLVGYYDPYDNAYGYGRGMRMFGSGGLGRGGASIGLGVGGGFGAGIGQRPIEVERVSLLVNDGYVRISRDIRRFDHLGDLRESYSASNDDFCQRFKAALPQSTTERAL